MAPVAQALAASRWPGGIGHNGHCALYGPRHCGLRNTNQRNRPDLLGFRTRNNASDTLRHEGRFPSCGGAQPQAAENYTSRDTKPNEWASLKDEFNAMVRESADTIEDLLDEQFRRRFGE